MPDDQRNISRADELNHMGALLHNKGNVEAARMHYLAALTLEPNNSMALQNLSAALLAMDKLPAALSVGRRAIQASGGENVYAMTNMAAAMAGMKQYNEAGKSFLKALEKIPLAGGIWHNYGLCLYMIGDLRAALEAFKKALEFVPQDASGIYNSVKNDYAMTLMALYRLSEGLEAYEVRWQQGWNGKLYQSKIWTLDIKEWQGEDLNNKRILIHHEQGFGDSIMLCRFISTHVLNKGAIVTIAVPPPLLRLFELNFPNCPIFSWDDETLTNDYDFHSPMLSLMRWINPTKDEEFGPTKYLTAPINEIQLPNYKRIGLCWASGDHGNVLAKRRRYIDLELFLPLTEIEGVKVISLQKGEPQNDLVRLGTEGIIFDPMARVEDFADTAAVISDLDIVVSVDSAVAHLAGALGKPVMMLGPYTRCWRWWHINNGLPWYNNFNIFTQSEDGSWNWAVRTILNRLRRI